MNWCTLFCLLLITCSCTHSPKPLKGGRDPSWHPEDLGIFTVNTNAFTNAVMEELNLQPPPIQIQDMNTTELFQYLHQGLLDVILYPLPIHEETKALYDMTRPILELGPILIVPTQSDIRACCDLTNKKVGVYAYTSSILLVQGVDGIILETYTNIPTAMQRLLAGDFDAIVAPPLEAKSLIISQYSHELTALSPPLSDEGIRLITLKGHHLKEMHRWNQQINDLYESGHMAALRTEFGVP